MYESELWVTRVFNDFIPGAGNAARHLVGLPGVARPWQNFVTMQFVVVAVLMIVFALLRPRLSALNPGKFQHTFEVVHEFLHSEANDQVGHDGHKYLPFFGTIFLFILFANLIGIIPGFESPTMEPWVPCGCALATFCYYNIMGLREQGVFSYLKHFAGPMPILAPLMVPIEIISHLARPLSLTIRLFANMYAGEQVTTVFLGLTYFVIPALFMGLHVFVALLQAYIFVLLTMMYVAGAVAHEH